MDFYFAWHQTAGVIGTLLYVSSYFLIQVGQLDVDGYSYSLLNLTAAVLVGVSLCFDFNLASALIQILWILISLVGMARLFMRHRKIKYRKRRPYELARIR